MNKGNLIFGLIMLAFFVGIAIAAQLYKQRGKRELQRLKHIKILIELSEGNKRAMDLYDEACGLCRYYGILPDQFGYMDFDEFRKAALDSLDRHLEFMHSPHMKHVVAHGA